MRIIKNYGFFIIACFILTLILCLLAFAFQGSRGIWQPDEGYYVGTAITMLQKGTLLIPYLGEEEIFLDKPPMVYWQIILGLKFFGHNEFAVRFFHGLCFVLTSLIVGFLSWEMFKDRKVAFLSTFIYATMIIPFIAANFVTPDTPLALWTTAAIFFFWKSQQPSSQKKLWQLLMCLVVGLGVLSKGPAVFIPCAGIFVFLAIRKQLIHYFCTPWIIVCFLIFVMIGLGWYLYISIKVPGSLSYFFDSQIWGRLVSEKYKRNPGLLGALIYLPVLIFGSLPWSFIWIEKRTLIRDTLFKKSSWKRLANKPEILFLICWFFVPLAILCLASSKLGLYTLPIFPALAMATAYKWKKKIPDIGGLAVKEQIGTFSRPAALCSIWIILLVFSKLALAYYPTPNNMKMLWVQLQDKLPKTDYELCTIDERADGLLFYGAKVMEHITIDADTYPTFTRTEYILDEIKDMIGEKRESGLFLIRENDEVIKACKIFKKAGIRYEIIELLDEHVLLIPDLLVKTAPNKEG